VKSCSTLIASVFASRNAVAVEGASRPVSMALTSAREMPLASASSCWDQLRA